jgi:hypothetical protein
MRSPRTTRPRLRAAPGAYDRFLRAFAESGDYIVVAYPSVEFPKVLNPNAVFAGLVRAYRRLGPTPVVIQQSRLGVSLRNPAAAERSADVLDPELTEALEALEALVAEAVELHGSWDAYIEHALNELGPTRFYP